MSSTAARIAIGDVVSSTAANLARKSLRAMLFGQLKAGASVAVFLIALVGLAWGLGTQGQDKAGSRDAPRMQSPRTAPAAPPVAATAEKPADNQTAVSYRGRVLDPLGNPVTGARLYVVQRDLKQPAGTPVRAISDASGRFRFSIPRSEFDTSYWETPWSFSTVLAQAEGYAFGVANDLGDGRELALQLARDDVPISGRIIDLEGHPVGGVMVKVVAVRIPAKGSLDEWLKLVEELKDPGRNGYPDLVNPMVELPSPTAISPVTTAPDGTFRFEGIGRERIVKLQVEGPTIETRQIDVVSRPGKTVRFPTSPNRQNDEPVTIYGATFEHVAAPTRPIEGVVLDLDTGKPLAGILVHSDRTMTNRGGEWRVQAITNDQGHYRLVGLPRGREGDLVAIPPIDMPPSALEEGRLPGPPARGLTLSARPGGRPGIPLRSDIARRHPSETGGLGDRPGPRPVHRQTGRSPP